MDISEDHEAIVGRLTVRRALPRRQRRTVGAWCFADHMGPANIDPDHGLDIAPHPHIGLQTVTWLLDGEALHRDSLGSEQVIKPGQLNLMTAGHGVSHSEESTGSYRGRLHGLQLWVALPSASRDGEAAFAHHEDLPVTTVDGVEATVLVGSFGGQSSPARHDTALVGVDLALGGTADLPLEADFEHGLIVLSGALQIGEAILSPGQFGYLPSGRDELGVAALEPTRAMLLGGVPFDEQLVMWWNFVGRSHEEITQARNEWQGAEDRFGRVASTLPRIPAPDLPWAR